MRCYLLLLWLWAGMAAGRPLEIDINPDVDRRDVLTRGMETLNAPKNTTTVRGTYDDVTITIRAARIEAEWWRAGYDTGATFATDGIVATGELEIQIDGLAAGRHSLATFHNALRDKPASKYHVSVGQTTTSVQPAWRVKEDADAAAAYVMFDAKENEPVVVLIRSEGKDPVTINGLAIDLPDPTRQARKPFPADGDEHAEENPTLRWSDAKPPVKFDVYLGTRRDAVAAATPQSPEYRGRTGTKSLQPGGLNSWDTYYWRVDSIHGDTITPGRVWNFRVRQLAFPGAEGYGRFARGGRGGKVYAVTNLNDSGPGPLREAVEASGPRTVVFRVGGTIKLESKLVIKNPYLTIAGQTTPGDGIAVRGATFGMLGTHDVILRYVRIRVGDESGQTFDGTGMGGGTDHSIIDHCSISWTIDEAASSRGGRNITFQRNLIAEALNMSVHSKYVGSGKGHSFAGSISGNIGSFHHNLLANCAGRNWSLAGGLKRGGGFDGYLDIRNNVVFNWAHRTNDGGAKAVNLVGNYYIPGPATKVFHLLDPDAGTPADPQQYYVAGNVMEGRPQYDRDNWRNGGVRADRDVIEQIRLAKPFCEPYVTTHSARQAYESVIADVGANLPRHDAVDERTLRDVIARKTSFRGSKTGMPGIIDSQADVGGWPELRDGPAPEDTDGDGMPDAWETAQKLDPKDPADGNAGGAVTNLERYLQWIIDHKGKLVP